MGESKDKKPDQTAGQVNQKQRLSYIGFEVFPDEAKELFQSDAEKEKYVNGVLKKRSSGDIIREDCTLLGERVSGIERIVLTLSSVLVIGSLFLPWYSVYNEIVEEQPTPIAIVDTSDLSTISTDSLNLTSATDSSVTPDDFLANEESQLAATDNGATTDEVSPKAETAEDLGVEGAGIRGNEEIIRAQQISKSIHKDYEKLEGWAAYSSLGSVGSGIFSSGFFVLISAIMMLAYGLLCLAIPGYTLYGIYGLKGQPDDVALKLKKILRLNWIPVVLFFVVLFISFFGGSYSPTVIGTFTSIGDSYGIDVFLGVLSWGVFVSLAGFIMIAVKGVEI